MLTPDDLSRDGQKLQYLQAAPKWRHRDPELFDSLSAVASRDDRSVSDVAAALLLPGARFHDELVPRDLRLRRLHFERTLEIANGSELLFFDPDNGLEVASCAPGRSGSEKYLLWSELTDAYQAGHSILVYQHFGRQKREPFVTALSERIANRTGACEVFAFQTAGVVFLLAPQHGATEWFAAAANEIVSRWAGTITPSFVAVA